MRSMRRGTKEMDLILHAFAEQNLGGMSARMLDLYEALLEQNDQDLYAWVSGQSEIPEKFELIVLEIRRSLPGN